MIHICTLKYGTKYPSKNVNRLYNSIKHIPDIRFICMTEDASGLDENIVVIPIGEDPLLKRQWNKLRFFDPNFIGASSDDEVIIMDIDQVFIGDPEKLIKYPVNTGEQLYAFRWWTNQIGTPINSGVSKFKADGSNLHVLQKFLERPSYWMMHYHLGSKSGLYKEKFPPFFGEQRFIWQNLQKTHDIVFWPKEYIVKYDSSLGFMDKMADLYRDRVGGELIVGDKLNPRSVLVHFAGPNNDYVDDTFICLPKDYSKVVIDSETYKQQIGGKAERWDKRGQFQLQLLIDNGLKPEHKLVDVGCGPLRAGEHLISYLNESNYTGVDFNDSFIKVAKELTEGSEKNPTLYVVKDFQFEGKFDYILLFSVLNHCTSEDRLKFFTNVRANLKEGSKIVISHAWWLTEDLYPKIGLRPSKSLSKGSYDLPEWGFQPLNDVFPIHVLEAF